MKKIWAFTLYDLLTDPTLVPAVLREGGATLVSVEMNAEQLSMIYHAIQKHKPEHTEGNYDVFNKIVRALWEDADGGYKRGGNADHQGQKKSL